jgi:dynactin complex subunit
MKSKTANRLIVSLILSVGYLTSVIAVTDAELEALEKQLEQLESEKLKQVEEEAKQKAEEEKRIAEDEHLRAEQEARAQAEAEKQKKEEVKRAQFSQYLKNGDSAMENKEYTEALSEYAQALVLFPDDSTALSSQSRAQELKDACAALVGEWDWSFDIFVTINADGNMQSRALIPNHGTWECKDPLQRKFTLRWVVGGWVENVTMSIDGNTLDIINNIAFRYQAWRKGTKEFDPSREIPL